jgi:hypothetical protein
MAAEPKRPLTRLTAAESERRQRPGKCLAAMSCLLSQKSCSRARCLPGACGNIAEEAMSVEGAASHRQVWRSRMCAYTAGSFMKSPARGMSNGCRGVLSGSLKGCRVTRAETASAPLQACGTGANQVDNKGEKGARDGGRASMRCGTELGCVPCIIATQLLRLFKTRVILPCLPLYGN